MPLLASLMRKEKHPWRRNEPVKISETIIVVSVIGYYLLAVAALVEFVAVPGHPNAAAESQAQREYSDLQKDELSLTRDVKLLRRELRRGAGVVAVAKDRNFVRQDLLNIVLDRWEPAEESRDLERDQDLASIIGESFAAPAQELIHILEPASRS